jgi:hypothetical protein
LDQSIISRCPGLIEAEVDGELVGLHVENGTCYGFNATATRIWHGLAEPKTLAQLVELMTAEFRVTPADCEADLKALLAELEADGLIQIHPEPGAPEADR